jgi:hypothetical protein
LFLKSHQNFCSGLSPLEDSIPGLLKSFAKSGSGLRRHYSICLWCDCAQSTHVSPLSRKNRNAHPQHYLIKLRSAVTKNRDKLLKHGLLNGLLASLCILRRQKGTELNHCLVKCHYHFQLPDLLAELQDSYSLTFFLLPLHRLSLLCSRSFILIFFLRLLLLVFLFSNLFRLPQRLIAFFLLFLLPLFLSSLIAVSLFHLLPLLLYFLSSILPPSP